MRAMIFKKPGIPLKLVEDWPIPQPGPTQVLIKVHACGICRTDLHVIDGELTHPKLPLVPGHQIIGKVVKRGSTVDIINIGDRIGVPWLGGSCGQCHFCLSGRENLCDNAIYTGYQIDGGFAEYCVANAAFCFPIPVSYSDLQAAPLLCAGLIGYRALKMAGDAKILGFYGFGASAHILIQVAKFQKRKVFVLTRQGDQEAQQLAEKLGADWIGHSGEKPPIRLEAAIIFAPIGSLVLEALQAVDKGGRVICAGIHMSNIPTFPYQLLWGERAIQSVANLTRQDGHEFFALAPQVPVTTTVNVYPLERVNEALSDLRRGKFSGAAVIAVES